MTKMTSRSALTFAIETLSAMETPNTEVIAKLTTMVEALDRKASKSASTSHKPTAKQMANDAIKQEILTLLSEGEKSIPQLMDGITVETSEVLTSQRVSALLTQLKKEGAVMRCEGKAAIFALASETETEEDAE